MKASWYMAGTVTMMTSAPATASAASLVTAARRANPVAPAVVSESAVTSMPPRVRAASSLSARAGNSNSVTSIPLRRAVGGDGETGAAGAAYGQTKRGVHVRFLSVPKAGAGV